VGPNHGWCQKVVFGVAGKGKGVAREGRGKAAMTDTFREEQKLVEGLAKHLRFESRGSWLRGGKHLGLMEGGFIACFTSC